MTINRRDLLLLLSKGLIGSLVFPFVSCSDERSLMVLVIPRKGLQISELIIQRNSLMNFLTIIYPGRELNHIKDLRNTAIIFSIIMNVAMTGFW